MAKQANQIIGAFTLRNEGDGCLTSKYHHGDSVDGPFTESCKLITPLVLTDVFIGTYRTIWLEDANHAVAQLIIRRNPINGSIFQLSWLDENSNSIFEGTAMIFDNILVGAYWNDH
ncbi:hypothetical protein [Sediminibacterium ginsengisoli]|uniref:Uncharacterized protein n=1 Tax=Sediminibacterium ginsengisoli TaxID=413434 RepID=A0A1T4JPI2_9BACT|nr:hypothetical protein [Sediminibacterium ginsengisoli]SJZ32078.1 hypothetical protein SAMN04488132_10138 [Sediminibacterium ginsengisoli]